jgi:5-methylcytosine-specific restriction endonuclease McrA
MTDCTSKQCTKCKEWKPATLEYFNKHGKRLRSQCKACSHKIHGDWQKTNPEKVYENNKRWRMANLDKRREQDKRYRESHPKKMYEAQKRYRETHPEKRRILEQHRRARKASLPATLMPQQWEDIKAEFNYSCAYCRRAWYDIEGALAQDHVIPIKQGGPYTKENIVPACKSCNSRKKDRTPEQAGMTLHRPMKTSQDMNLQ